VCCASVCVCYLDKNTLWNFIRHRSRYETRQHTITPNPKPAGESPVNERECVCVCVCVCVVLLSSPAELLGGRPGETLHSGFRGAVVGLTDVSHLRTGTRTQGDKETR